MRNLLLIPILLIIFGSFSTGCSHQKPNGTSSTVRMTNGTVNEEQVIVVQKHIGREFEEFRKITDEKQVNKVTEILNELKWEYAKRDTFQAPDYQFVFQPQDLKVKAEGILYKIWITPDKDRLVVGRGKDQYALKVTKQQSATLFEILTGDKLVK